MDKLLHSTQHVDGPQQAAAAVLEELSGSTGAQG
jgi:hypothetical protein